MSFRRLVLLVVATLVVTPLTAIGAGALVQTFTDVPPGHPFFDEIEWMAANGISTGYADGTYRPADVVTRQAMSAFMERLGTSRVWADGARVDADVSGFDGEDGATALVSKVVDAPVDGFFAITATINAGDTCSTGDGIDSGTFAWLDVDGSQVSPANSGFQNYEDCASLGELGTVAGETTTLTAFVPVSAGARTVNVVASVEQGNVYIYGTALTVVFSANGPAPVLTDVAEDHAGVGQQP